MATPSTLRLQLLEKQAERLRLENAKKLEDEQKRRDQAKSQEELEELKKILAEAEAAEDAGNQISLEQNRLAAEASRKEVGLGKSEL